MADWTQIPDATFDTDRPVLGSTHLAIVRNFEAMAEGANNAPRIFGSAIRHNEIARLDIATTVSAPITFTGLDAHFGIVVVAQDVRGFGSDVTQAVSIQVSNNNGSSWTTAFFMPVSGNQRAFAHIHFGPTTSFYAGGTERVAPVDNTYIADRFSFSGPCNAVRFQAGGTSPQIAPGTVGDGFVAVYGLVRERE